MKLRVKNLDLGPNIILYGTMTCPACLSQLKLLDDHYKSKNKKLNFMYYNLDKKKAPSFLMNAKGEYSMPTWYSPYTHELTVGLILPKNFEKTMKGKKYAFGSIVPQIGTLAKYGKNFKQTDFKKDFDKNKPDYDKNFDKTKTLFDIPNSWNNELTAKWGNPINSGTLGREFGPGNTDMIYSKKYFNAPRMAYPGGDLSEVLSTNYNCNMINNPKAKTQELGLFYDSKTQDISTSFGKRSRGKNSFGNYMDEPEYNPDYQNNEDYKEYIKHITYTPKGSQEQGLTDASIANENDLRFNYFIKSSKKNKEKECDDIDLNYLHPHLRASYCQRKGLISTKQTINNFCSSISLPKNIHITPIELYNFINNYEKVKWGNEGQRIIDKFYNNLNEITTVWCLYVKWLYCKFESGETFSLSETEIWKLKEKIKQFFTDLQMRAVGLTTGIIFLYENNFIEGKFPEECLNLKTSNYYGINGLIPMRKKVVKVSGGIKKKKLPQRFGKAKKTSKKIVKFVKIVKSKKKGKKYTITFKIGNKIKIIHFGNINVKGKLKDKKIKKLKSNDPTNINYLNRFILFNKKTLKASIADYKKRLTIYNKTKKNAFGNLYSQMGPAYKTNYLVDKNTTRDLHAGAGQNDIPRPYGIQNKKLYIAQSEIYNPIKRSQTINDPDVPKTPVAFGSKKTHSKKKPLKIGEGTVISIKKGKLKFN